MAAGASARARRTRDKQHLAAHVTGPDLELHARPPALVRHQLAEGVELVFFEGVELTRRAARVHAGQAHLEQDVQFGVQQVEVDALVRADGQQHGAPRAAQRLTGRGHLAP